MARVGVNLGRLGAWSINLSVKGLGAAARSDLN